MKTPGTRKFPPAKGFTLIELLATVAIIGVLLSVAVPWVQTYTIQARTTEGILLLEELRRRIEIGFNEANNGALPDNLPASPAPDGQLYGGPYYNYETLYGQSHEMWQRIEYQPKGPHRVIALRAYRRPEWGNSDIGLHLQIKVVNATTLDFRCTVNETQDRIQYVPSSCQDGTVNDWTSW